MSATSPSSSSWKRSHDCGELTLDHVGQEVVLNGWIENHRDHGGALVFVDLRDRFGVTQVVFNPEHEAGNPDKATERARRLGFEDVIAVRGKVAARDADKINSKRSTGTIEVLVEELHVLAEADPPPFVVVDDPDASEELRMRYRYLDLRRRPLADCMVKRAALVTAIRNVLADHRFVDVETPILTKSTPEGARDYLVPSRVHPGNFYALPQSPQIFKQLLMVAGLDRYYQIARCFRDEDLRADRQPEFTQIDLEMSFVDEEDVYALVETMMVRSFEAAFGVEAEAPFPRLDYAEAMARYGSDKPDLRFGMEIQDVGDAVRGCGFKVFDGALDNGGSVKGLRVEGQAGAFSRKDIDKLTALVGEYGAKGLAWLKVGEEMALQGPIAKFVSDEGVPNDKGRALCSAMGAAPGDLLLLVADRTQVVHRSLGELRVHLGGKLGLRTQGEFKFCWVTNFPMFEWNDDRGRWESSHHPFTAPDDWDADLKADPGSVRSRAYDLVLNGWELGSGSVRIHRRDVQSRVFDFLGISEEEQKARFGFLLEAFRYGAPPHAGIALGVDRIVALAMGRDSLRDVIAFPKTTSATDLMCDAPDTVDAEQLAELHIVPVAPPKKDG